MVLWKLVWFRVITRAWHHLMYYGKLDKDLETIETIPKFEIFSCSGSSA